MVNMQGGRTSVPTGTGVYAVISVMIFGDAARSISKYGIRGVRGAYSVGMLSFCVGSWIGIWKSDKPLSKSVDSDRS